MIQTTESLHCYPGALGRDHWRLLADALGAQFHHRCDAHQAAWDGQSECLPIRHSLCGERRISSEQPKGQCCFSEMQGTPDIFWDIHYSLWVFNLQGHIKLFNLCVLKKDLTLCLQRNIITETSKLDDYPCLTYVLTLSVFLFPFALDKREFFKSKCASISLCEGTWLSFIPETNSYFPTSTLTE